MVVDKNGAPAYLEIAQFMKNSTIFSSVGSLLIISCEEIDLKEEKLSFPYFLCHFHVLSFSNL